MFSAPARQPKILLVAVTKDFANDCVCWLTKAYQISVAQTEAEVEKGLSNRPDTVIMMEGHNKDLEMLMPELASSALAINARVIRLTADTHRFDPRWDPRVIHLPWGVKPEVLLAAIKGTLARDVGA